MLGIKWDSIDYENMTVTIKHTVVQGNNLYEKDSTKNESSYRTYPMSEEIKKSSSGRKSRRKKIRKDSVRITFQMIMFSNGITVKLLSLIMFQKS